MSEPNWTLSPPSLFDIVTGFYPETNPRAGTPALRPCLVTHVYQNTETGAYACEIVYGTKNLKTLTRSGKDLIIQNYSDMCEVGLPVATRFDLDANKRVILEWAEKNFKPWPNHRSPKIGSLTEDYQKDYAWLMMRRMGV